MSRTIYYIDLDREKRNSAASKAPDDIAQLCDAKGYKRFVVPNFPTERNMIFQKIWILIVCTGWWLKIGKVVHENDVVFFQHPMYGKRIAMKMIRRIKKKSRCHFIAVIHDLESLRGGMEGIIHQNTRTNKIGDNELLKCFDAVICHNTHMKQYMMTQGFDASKLIDLEIFDYLNSAERIQSIKEAQPSIAIAGNLAIGKSKYIYDICVNEHNQDLVVNLYGNHFENSRATDNMKWHGSFQPEELPKHLHGDFGLVWDGIAVKTCAGNTGEYLRYNNPHKTSLYLSSGMPVIVWSKAAIADFVVKNGVGIAIDNLLNLEQIIRDLSTDEYKVMCDNVQKIAKLLHEGHYFSSAFDKAISVIDKI